MSNGQIALKELGIPVEKYYASEIDRFAIHNTQFNFPDTVQLGDVTKWREWDIPWGKIDLLLAGSPCQDVSMAGRMEGLKDGTRSNLFFTWVDILRHVQTLNPDVKFLLENVKMKKEFLRHFNETLGLYPVLINSALVSAQNRSRYYWTNIRTRREGLFGELHTDIPQPKDKGLLLKDILDKDVPEKYYLKDEVLKKMLESNKRKAADGLTGFMTTPPTPENKMGTLCVKGTWKVDLIKEYSGRVRRLTPHECCKLQTVPDWYKWDVSETQRYKMLGNGWTVDVIKHILSFMD